jgi:hypothetical protein
MLFALSARVGAQASDQILEVWFNRKWSYWQGSGHGNSATYSRERKRYLHVTAASKVVASLECHGIAHTSPRERVTPRRTTNGHR